MNATDWARCARLLESALESAGLVVERADVIGGNIKSWQPITADQIMGRWMQSGWRIRDVSQPIPLSIVQEDEDDAS